MGDYLCRTDPNWDCYEIELDGKRLDRRKVHDACESKGYVNLIVRDEQSDEYGFVTRPAVTSKTYGRVHIIRMR